MTAGRAGDFPIGMYPTAVVSHRGSVRVPYEAEISGLVSGA